MKTILKSALSSAALVFCLFLRPAHADTIAHWTFEPLALSAANTNTPPDGWLNDIAPETGSGTASGFHADTATAYSTPAGNGSPTSISANHWSVNDYYEFAISTSGFKDINLSYDQTGSSTGPANFQLSYSVNGTDFTPFDSYTVSQVSWSSGSSTGSSAHAFDLSSVTDLNNQPAVYFQIVDVGTASIGGSVVASGGTDRIDNFIVTATLVPEPSIIAISFVGGFICLMAARRKR